jgi:hypothetical protein
MESGQLNPNQVGSASTAAADSLASFEAAMDRLVGRLEITGGQIQRLMEMKDRAEVVIDRVTGFSKSAVNEVKKNPKSFIALGVILGWLVWSHTQAGPKLSAPEMELH